MRKISMLIAALALVAAFGCKNQNQDQTANQTNATSSPSTTVAQTNGGSTLTPEQLGELGAKIKKHPHDAQKLLSEQGLTEQTFEQQVRKVAEDPASSRRYAQAYKHARA